MKKKNHAASGDGGVGRREVLKASAAALGAAVIPVGIGRAQVEGPPERRPPAAVGSRPGAGSPFPALFDKAGRDLGPWSASWVGCTGAEEAPVVAAYRLRFDWPEAATVALHVSADERYELFLDGRLIGRGSERGNLEHWFYESYDVALATGAHVLVARVFALGPLAPLAQFHVRPAFLLAADGEEAKRLETGVALWEARPLPGYSFEPPVYVWGLRAPVTVDASGFAWGFERGEGDGWQPVLVHDRASSTLADYGIAPSRTLQAGTLPPMIDRPWTRARVRHVSAAPSLDTLPTPVRAADHLEAEAVPWQDLVLGRAPLVVPANTLRRVIVDLEDYVCAYPELVTSGGAGSLVRLQLAEALREAPDKWNFAKGNRDAIEGRYFLGMGDSFRPDGGEHRRFDTLWFGAGRYLEVVVQTVGEPLTLGGLSLRETRYPLELESRFTAANQELDALQPMLVRGMQMCAHETYFDCPYFEQMQYVADARIEALVQYVMTRDDRLPRKALYLIDASRHASGLTESRYPVRQPQFIPWFSLVYVGAVHDYACWRDDPGFVRALLPGVRGVIEAFLARRGSDGLVRTPEGWNDSEGTKERAVSALTHWMLVWTLRLAAELEDGFGEPEPAARWRRVARELAHGSDRAFWNEKSGLYADRSGGKECSELVQCLALLGGALPPARRDRVAESLLRGGAAEPATVHTTHYLFEAARLLGRPRVVFDRLAFWVELRRLGLKTPVESTEPTRSDCHAWGSHPLFHFFATLLGIRPAGWGFREVEISPLLGPLPCRGAARSSLGRRDRGRGRAERRRAPRPCRAAAHGLGHAAPRIGSSAPGRGRDALLREEATVRTLEQQMGFYAAYHQDARNKATHFVGVPMIVFSLFIALGWARIEVAGVTLTAAMLLAAAVLAWYFLLDVPLAATMLVVNALLLYLADPVSRQPIGAGAVWFVVLFGGGWVIQLVGHWFEGRKPALADNLFQVFVAPIFLAGEVFFALGYKPALHGAVQRRAREMRAAAGIVERTAPPV